MPNEPLIKHAMAFFDGQNLFQHAKSAFGYHHPNHDPLRLHAALCNQHGWIPNLVRYYTGIPSPDESPMWAGYWTKRIMAMKRAGIHVTTRPLRYRKTVISDNQGNERIVTVAQEKGIDIRLALDLVSTARRREWDVAVIYSQDQDLAEVVEEIVDIRREQGRWLKVCSAFPAGEKATSPRGIARTDWLKIDRQLYDQCLDPYDYRPR